MKELLLFLINLIEFTSTIPISALVTALTISIPSYIALRNNRINIERQNKLEKLKLLQSEQQKLDDQMSKWENVSHHYKNQNTTGFSVTELLSVIKRIQIILVSLQSNKVIVNQAIFFVDQVEKYLQDAEEFIDISNTEEAALTEEKNILKQDIQKLHELTTNASSNLDQGQEYLRYGEKVFDIFNTEKEISTETINILKQDIQKSHELIKNAKIILAEDDKKGKEMEDAIKKSQQKQERLISQAQTKSLDAIETIDEALYSLSLVMAELIASLQEDID
ncbi:MAG: hypothetical protein ACFE0Q_10835 [Anaerolineae bacterium]